MADVTVTIDYEARVNRALEAGKQILDQADKLSGYQKRQLDKAAEFSRTLEQLNKLGPRAFGSTSKAAGELSDQLARLGVFANKTFASMAGSIQSVGTALKSAFSGVGQGIGGALGSGSSFLSEFSRSLSDFIGTGGLIQKLGTAVAAGAGGIIRVGTQIGSLIIRGVGEAASTLPKIIGELIQFTGAASGLISGIGATLFKAGGIAVGLFISGVSNAAGAVVKTFGSIFEGITSLAVSTFTGIGNLIASSLQGAVSVVSAIADRISATLGELAGKIGDTVGKVFAGALAVALPAAFKAAEFRDGLSSAFGVVVNQIEEEEFQRLVSGAKRVASQVGIELGQVPQAIFKVVSRGFDTTEQALTDFGAAAKLAAVGNVQLFDAIDTVNQVLDTFGTSAGNASQVANQLFQGTRRGRIEIKDLTDTLGFVAGSAEFAGIKFDELLTVINLARRTLPASTAVLGLANAIKALGSPSEKATKDMGDFLDKVKNVDGSIKSFRAVLEEIRAKGLTVDSAAFRELFPDERGARAIKALLNATKDGFKEYGLVLKDINGSTVDFETASEHALNTISRRAQAVSTSFLSLVDTVLEKFKGPIVSGFDSVSKVIQRVEDQVRKLNTAFIGTITRSVVDFVETLPMRLAGVKRVFDDIVGAIVQGAKAAREFADEQLNLTTVLRNFLTGDFASAFDTLIGSKGIQRVRSFFSGLKAEFMDGLNFIKNLVLAGVGAIQKSMGTIGDSIPGFGLIKALTPSSLTSGEHSPAELAAQTMLGVNPIQASARVGADTIGRAGTWGVTGAAIGMMGGGPPGALIVGGLAAIAGAITGWMTTTSEIGATQKAIRDIFKEIADNAKAQLKYMQERDAIRQKGNALISPIEAALGKASSIQGKISAVVSEADISAAPKRARIGELQGKIEDTEREIFAVQMLGFDSLQDWAKFTGEAAAAAEIVKKQEERKAKVDAAAAEMKEAFEARIADADAKILAAKEKVAALTKGPSETFIRSMHPDVTNNLALGGGVFDNTVRATDLVGGPAEGRLVNAIEALINALHTNENAQRALKQALDPKNLDENTPGLNTRARTAIRRAKRDRAKALAEEINAQFTPRPQGMSEGVFGFGGSSVDQFLRAAAFGGVEGFGGSLPGETTRGSRTSFLNTTLGSLNQAMLPNFQRTGLIDAAEMLTGAPSASGRVRGRKNVFGEVTDKELQRLNDSVEELARSAQIFGEGANVEKELLNLKKTERDRLGAGATDTEVMTKVLDTIKQVIENDRQDKKEFKDSADLKKAKKEVAAEELKKAGLVDKLKGVADAAEKKVKPIDEAAITKNAVEEATTAAKAKEDALNENKKELEAVQSELKKIADESLAEVQSLQTELIGTMKEANTTMTALADTSLDIFNKFNDIGIDFLNAANALQDKMTAVWTRSGELEKSVADLQRRLKGP